MSEPRGGTMDLVWIGALAALWVAAAELALWLHRLGRPRKEQRP
ncbi:hypothetical protein [Paracidovorax wautersii]|uniref:Uncharacterized protein n=1 Tax=Paracidovorax wautersii TaxID=1177982 RepID=A0ABU1ID49_9BURK|nr:hypothetical protein [Paracidovorax wautersii]MDR6215161.1 hypothetical protein [Paracidovorax wautersii]